MNNKADNTKRIWRRLLSVCALIVCAVFIVLSPDFISERLWREQYKDWLQTETEPQVLIINVWHIVGFKPFCGSLGGWLDKCADNYSKNLIGIHFEVNSYTEEQAQGLLKRGIKPDIISFMNGTIGSDYLFDITDMIDCDNTANCYSGMLNGRLYAVPYCASGNLLVYDPAVFLGYNVDDIILAAGTADEFRLGKKSAAICDIKAAGDIYRAGVMGKAPYFEAVPYLQQEPSFRLQYIGAASDIAANKLKYAIGFINTAISAAAQSELCPLGLLPINSLAEAEYEQEYLGALYEEFDTTDLPRCFGN